MGYYYPTVPSALPVDEPPPLSYDIVMEGEGLPPSCGQFRSIDSPSAFAKFIKSSFEALSRTVAATIIFTLLNIGMIIIGSMNEENCPVQPVIPTWLIVLGSMLLARDAMVAYAKWKQFKAKMQMQTLYRPHICIILFNLLLVIAIFVWLILGTVWVFGTSPNYSKDSGEKYCDHFMYMFSYVVILMWDTFLALLCMSFMACCCYFCCMLSRLSHNPRGDVA